MRSILLISTIIFFLGWIVGYISYGPTAGLFTKLLLAFAIVTGAVTLVMTIRRQRGKGFEQF